MVFSIAKRLSTIKKCWCYINHHIPTTFGCHGNVFGLLDYLFTNTMVYHHIFLEMFQSQNIYIYVPLHTKLRLFTL